MSRWYARALIGLTLVACEVEEPPRRAPSPLPIRSAQPVLHAAPPPQPTCEERVPSLTAVGPLDARSDAALSECIRPSTGPGRAARRCGQDGEVPPIPLQRLARAVVPMDEATVQHVREVYAKGTSLGRRQEVFGLVGDSMTVSGAFLPGPPTDVDDALRDTLVDSAGESVIDWYAGVHATRVRGAWRDSFGAPRTAKVGARAEWAIRGGGTRLKRMVDTLSPAIAVVLFGGNDAAYTAHTSIDDLADRFSTDLHRIIDRLEQQGVIVVLNTLARHGSSAGFEDCGSNLTNWRIAVQTNALSARVAEIACERSLPLIDVRDALDTAVNLGLGSDQVHPSMFEHDPRNLEARGLMCGYNVRNYVTLLMLKRIKELVFNVDVPGNRPSNR